MWGGGGDVTQNGTGSFKNSVGIWIMKTHRKIKFTTLFFYSFDIFLNVGGVVELNIMYKNKVN